MKSLRIQKKHILVLIIAVLIPIIVGVFSAFLTAKDMKIYETMEKPPLSPPGWLFPIVWTLLYAMMGFASFYVCVSDADTGLKRKALTFYAAQLIMNMFWSTLFFTYGLYLLSLIWLLAMWVLIIAATVVFWKINRASGIMMGVLVIWTTFAAYLNLGAYIISIR